MHILLTDVLACPRCGPAFGLILLADRIENRRVREGVLGCANCRERYPVRAGVADLRRGAGASFAAGAPPALAVSPPPADAAEEAYRVAALLGLGEGRGRVLLAGVAPEIATALAALVPELEVALAVPAPEAAERAGAAIGAVAADGLPPFQAGSMRGVAISGAWTNGAGLAAAAACLAPGGRLVVVDAPAGTGGALEVLGLRTLLEQDGFAVAAKGAGR